MHPADKIPADLRPELIHYSMGTGGSQVETNRRIGTVLPESQGRRRKILVCLGNARQRKSETLALQERGHEVIECDPTTECSSGSFDRLLGEAAVVRFDCSAVNSNALKRLLQICDYRRQHGMQPFLVCTGIGHDEKFRSHLADILKVDRFVNGGNGPGGENYLRDHDGFDARGWGLEIIHRWWVGETLCTPGEEVFNVNAFNNLRTESLPLSMKDRVVLDRFIRSRIHQSSSQWAASLNASTWVAKHGSRASGSLSFKCGFSRNGIKQTIWRLRSVIAAGFEKVGVDIGAMRIIESVECGRERKHRWNPEIAVVWEHVEC